MSNSYLNFALRPIDLSRLLALNADAREARVGVFERLVREEGSSPMHPLHLCERRRSLWANSTNPTDLELSRRARPSRRVVCWNNGAGSRSRQATPRPSHDERRTTESRSQLARTASTRAGLSRPNGTARANWVGSEKGAHHGDTTLMLIHLSICADFSLDCSSS